MLAYGHVVGIGIKFLLATEFAHASRGSLCYLLNLVSIFIKKMVSIQEQILLVDFECPGPVLGTDSWSHRNHVFAGWSSLAKA